MIYRIPKDNEAYRQIYEPQGRGVCGISVLAVLFKTNLKNIFDELKYEYKGYFGVKEMRDFLDRKGIKTKQKRGNKGYEIPKDVKTAMVRIQWKGKDGGDFHGYDSWYEASCHTHYILLIENYYFCNGSGFFKIEQLKDYLEEGDGYITSYLEIRK